MTTQEDVYDEITFLRARVAELEGGLRPFANEAGNFFPDCSDNDGACVCDNITIGDVRRARVLLTIAPKETP